jgi:hypothetical protein
MSENHTLLMQSRTGGLSLFAVILALVGFASLGAQIFFLIGGEMETMEAATRFLPGILGVVFLAMFAWLALRWGELSVYPDRIEGKTKAGRKYNYLLEQIGSVDLRGKALVLRDKEGKVVLTDQPPREPRIRGLVAMLLKHEMPAAVWKAFPEAGEDTGDSVVRMFLGADQLADFMDAGFLFEVGGRMLYLPESDTMAVPRNLEAREGLSTSLKSEGMVMKYDPSPGELPLRQLAGALMRTELEGKTRLSLFATLAEEHGGTFVEETEEGWAGEAEGWQVRMALPRKAGTATEGEET